MSAPLGLYFHGTAADLEIGDSIVTGTETGADHGRSEHVYMTYSSSYTLGSVESKKAIADAYAWARASCAVAAENNPEFAEDVEAFVYLVSPVGEVEADEEDGAGNNTVRTAGYARINAVISAYDLEALLPAGFVGEKYLDL